MPDGKEFEPYWPAFYRKHIQPNPWARMLTEFKTGQPGREAEAKAAKARRKITAEKEAYRWWGTPPSPETAAELSIELGTTVTPKPITAPLTAPPITWTEEEQRELEAGRYAAPTAPPVMTREAYLALKPDEQIQYYQMAVYNISTKPAKWLLPEGSFDWEIQRNGTIEWWSPKVYEKPLGALTTWSKGGYDYEGRLDTEGNLIPGSDRVIGFTPESPEEKARAKEEKAKRDDEDRWLKQQAANLAVQAQQWGMQQDVEAATRETIKGREETAWRKGEAETAGRRWGAEMSLREASERRQTELDWAKLAASLEGPRQWAKYSRLVQGVEPTPPPWMAEYTGRAPEYETAYGEGAWESAPMIGGAQGWGAGQPIRLREELGPEKQFQRWSPGEGTERLKTPGLPERTPQASTWAGFTPTQQQEMLGWYEYQGESAEDFYKRMTAKHPAWGTPRPTRTATPRWR